MGFATELAYNTFSPEKICLSVHLMCALFVCIHVYNYSDKYPYRQNSPVLTIASQLFLVLASIALLLSKVYTIEFL